MELNKRLLSGDNLITQGEIKALNAKVQVPLFLMFLGANIREIKPNRNHTEYRLPAYFRGGDNPAGLLVKYDFNDEKWRITDMTNRSIVNLDLIDFAIEVGGKGFRDAVDLMIQCSGKDNGYSNIKTIDEINLSSPQPMKKRAESMDKGILDTFEYGLHPYWHGRGYTPDVAEKFKLGWCNWGELKGRLTIPIFDEKRNLVSVQGRATDERLEPKYLFMDGTGESAKLTLYNYQHARIRGMERGWIGVVEGATDVWRAHQYGYHNFLSTLSTSVTNRQLELLVRTELNVVIMFDFDDTPTMPGQIGAIKLAESLKERNHDGVYVCNIGFHAGPSDLNRDTFMMTLKNAVKYN